MAHYEGEVRVEWLRHVGEDRSMKLLEEFAFVDDRGVRWVAPAGSVIDGASIPEMLWSAANGTPYVGDYRRATVLHDVACVERNRPSADVHRMFYDAMITDGVSKARALKMYTAVRLFGPHWILQTPRGAAEPRAFSVEPELQIDEVEDALDRVLGEDL
jgi:hypothetical protein